MHKLTGIDYNYHTHTFRCGHAYGTDEEYVLEAINQGFKFIGFADHGIYLSIKEEDGGRDHKFFQDYIDSIYALKKKYAGTAEILLGGEFEYSKELDWYFKELKEKYGYDYLICGQHSEIVNNKHNYYFHKMNDIAAIERYKNDVCDAIRSGHFAYIAHPDLFFNRITEITPKIIEFCEEIIKTAIEFDTPLELNLGGFNYNNIIAAQNGAYPYPCDEFFKLVGKFGAKVVIGVDAHLPSDFIKNRYDIVMKMVNDFNLNLIKDFRVK